MNILLEGPLFSSMEGDKDIRDLLAYLNSDEHIYNFYLVIPDLEKFEKIVSSY